MFGFFKKSTYYLLKSLQKELDAVMQSDIDEVAKNLGEFDETKDRRLTQKYVLPESAKRALVAHLNLERQLHYVKDDLASAGVRALLIDGLDSFEEVRKKSVNKLYTLKTLAQILQPMFWYEFHQANLNSGLPPSLGVRRNFEIVEYVDMDTDSDEVSVGTHPLEISNIANLRKAHHTGKSGWIHPPSDKGGRE